MPAKLLIAYLVVLTPFLVEPAGATCALSGWQEASGLPAVKTKHPKGAASVQLQ